MPGASEQTRQVKVLNANWAAGADGEDGHLELMIVTEDGQQHTVAPSPASMPALLALARAEAILLWDPTNRTLIAANSSAPGRRRHRPAWPQQATGLSSRGLDPVAGYRVHASGVRTSELAARAAVNPQTLRYYERRGLLAEPVRSPGGYRAYPAAAVRRVRFIKRAQELGFTLAKVQTLLDLAEGGPDSCEQVRRLADEKIADLRRRIADLQVLQAGLAGLVATCDLPRGQRECPILHELDPGIDGASTHGRRGRADTGGGRHGG